MFRRMMCFYLAGLFGLVTIAQADEPDYLLAELDDSRQWRLYLDAEPLQLHLVDAREKVLVEYRLDDCLDLGPIQSQLFLLPVAGEPLLVVDCRGLERQSLLLFGANQPVPRQQFTSKAPIPYRIEAGALVFADWRWPNSSRQGVHELGMLSVEADAVLRFGPNFDAPALATLNNPVQQLKVSDARLPMDWLLVRSASGVLGYLHASSKAAGTLAAEGGLDWYFSEDPLLLAFLAQALDLQTDGLAQVMAPRAGAWIARVDLNGDAQAELLAIPNHSCSNVACELAVLRHSSGGYQLLAQVQTFGQPRLSGKWRNGWRSLVHFELGEGPTCCAPRIALEFALDNQGIWRDMDPVTHAPKHDWRMQ